MLTDLKADGLRTLFIYLVPGAVAALPWLCVLVHEEPGLMSYGESHQVLAGTALVLAALAIGKFVDGIGSWWEVINDGLLKRTGKFPAFDDDWYRFLKMAQTPVPVAFDYINNLTQTLKFEINSGVALISFAFGVVALAWESLYLSTGAAVWSGVVCLLGSSVFLYNSYCSSRVLAEVRKRL